MWDVWEDILTGPSSFGGNEDSIDDSMDDGSNAASPSDIEVPVIDEEEDNVLLEDVGEPGDVVIWSEAKADRNKLLVHKCCCQQTQRNWLISEAISLRI